MRPSNEIVINNKTLADNFSSAAIDSRSVFIASVQCNSGTGAAGNVKIQASNDAFTGLDSSTVTVPTHWSDVANTSTAVAASSSTLVPATTMAFNQIRVVFTSTATGVQTVALVADVSGSLNSKYFLLNSFNNANKYYVWFNINSAGVDPAIAGRTGVPITGATNATAATLGTAVASAVAALAATNDFTTSGTSTVTITNKASGPFTPMVDGTAATGFTFGVTTPSGSISCVLQTQGV